MTAAFLTNDVRIMPSTSVDDIENNNQPTIVATEIQFPQTIAIAVAVDPFHNVHVVSPWANQAGDLFNINELIIRNSNGLIKIYALFVALITSLPTIFCDLIFAFDKSLCINNHNSIFTYFVAIGFGNVACLMYTLFELYFVDINDNLQITVCNKTMPIKLRRFIWFAFRIYIYIWSFIGLMVAMSSMNQHECGQSVYLYVVVLSSLRFAVASFANLYFYDKQILLV
jgi:hypothetical protein